MPQKLAIDRALRPVRRGGRQQRVFCARSGAEGSSLSQLSTETVPSYMCSTAASLLKCTFHVETDLTIQPARRAKTRTVRRNRGQKLSRFERLPEDVMLHISTFLGYTDIVRVRRVSHHLSYTTRLRSLWVSLIRTHGLGPMLRKRIDVQTSTELESVVRRKALGDRAWMDEIAPYVDRHLPGLAFVPPETAWIWDRFIAPGGRWLLFRRSTGIGYADLQSPDRGWRALVEEDNVVTLLVSYEVIHDSAYLSLRFAICGVRQRSPGSEPGSETYISVYDISVVFDGAGNIDGLETTLLLTFCIDGQPEISAINIYEDRLAAAFPESGIHRIISWRAAHGCRNTFPEISIKAPCASVWTAIKLLPNHFYLTWQGQYYHARLYDLSSLLPSPDSECHHLRCALTMDYYELDPRPILTPTFDDLSASVVFPTFFEIVKLSLPHTSHSQISPSLENVVSLTAHQMFLGPSKFLWTFGGMLSRSTPAHIFHDPESTRSNRARCVELPAPHVLMHDCDLLYDYLSDRMIGLRYDGEVYTLDIDIV